MGASDAVIKLLLPGDEVIATNDIYGGSYRMFVKVFEPFGIKFHFVNMYDAANISKYVNTNTKTMDNDEWRWVTMSDDGSLSNTIMNIGYSIVI